MDGIAKKKLKCTINMKVIPQTINKHNIIKFQAWTDSHINFSYHVRALYNIIFSRFNTLCMKAYIGTFSCNLTENILN